MTTNQVDAPVSKRVPRSVRTRLVMEARPDLIAAMEKAGEEFYRLEESWQAEATRQQRAGRMPEQELESPYRRALREASNAVVEKFEDMLASGAVTWPPVPTEKEDL